MSIRNLPPADVRRGLPCFARCELHGGAQCRLRIFDSPCHFFKVWLSGQASKGWWWNANGGGVKNRDWRTASPGMRQRNAFSPSVNRRGKWHEQGEKTPRGRRQEAAGGNLLREFQAKKRACANAEGRKFGTRDAHTRSAGVGEDPVALRRVE